MKKLKFTFKNAAGEELAGLLELPENPKAFALLAHCFTCGKDLKGAARIAWKLTEKGSAWKTESMVTPVFATPILTTSWLA